MGSTYANAKNVLVWLGPEANDSDLAMDLLGYSFGDKLLDKDLLEGSQSSIPNELQTMRRLKAVIKLFSRPWWQRGWVIQEIVEAGRCRENVLLHCGYSQKQWELVSLSMKAVVLAYVKLRQLWSKRESPEHEALWGTLVEVTHSPRCFVQASDHSIEEWLDNLRSFKTTDPKDKVWIAFLLTQHHEPIPGTNLQYRWPLRETYAFVVQHLLRSQGSLRVLEYCRTPPDLPSWVPDWRSAESRPISGGKADRFKACGTSELFFETVDKTYLHVRGFCFDWVGVFLPQEEYTNMGAPRTLRRLRKVVRPTYGITGEPSMKALIRIAFTDLSEEFQDAWQWYVASEEERVLPKPEYRGSDLPGEQDTHAHLILQAVLRTEYAISGRKYFVSAKGYMGLVPKATQEGDMICIFMGGRTPFVVRPAGENYQLIGACYVHGIMYGEAMTEFENQGGEMQDFVLV
jgi:hypothetical protein